MYRRKGLQRWIGSRLCQHDGLFQGRPVRTIVEVDWTSISLLNFWGCVVDCSCSMMLWEDRHLAWTRHVSS